MKTEITLNVETSKGLDARITTIKNILAHEGIEAAKRALDQLHRDIVVVKRSTGGITMSAKPL